MWIYSVHLFTVLLFVCFDLSYGLEKDIEVECLAGQATTITEGGVVANCAFQGLTRTSTIAPWLFQLANVLQSVNASNNHIKRVAMFPVLPRVLSLSLQHNSIREIEPLAFTGLENLQNLDLSHNRISGESLRGVLVGKKTVGQENYEPLPIRILTLSYNNISSLEPSLLVHLQFLRDLHLDYNPLSVTETFSEALRELPELRLLNLAGAGLTALPRYAFSGLRLTNLLLNGNQFTQVPDLSALGGSLRILDLNQNPVEELNSTSFSGLHSLSEVMISGMPKLSKIGSGTFSALENLRVVSCSYNHELIDINETAFWNHKISKRSPLQEVYLNNNALPWIKKNLLPWVKMSKVTLDGNRWVCDCRLHWLATYLRTRNNTIDRLTELKCWEPIWLNGTQMVFWNINKQSRHENYPCLAELEQEQKDRERERLEQEQLELKNNQNSIAPPIDDVTEGSTKLYHLVAISGLILLVIIIGIIIAFNKYKNYRPIYNVEKMSSPMHNEMKYMKGSLAEKTQLVP